MTDPRIASLRDLARERLAPHIDAYYAATAGTAAERDADLAEWDAVRLRPAALRGPLGLPIRTTVLGTSVDTPILIAPMAQQVAAHPEGEAVTARAARRAGTLLGVSSNTGVAFDAIAAAGAPWWFQSYLLPDEDLSLALVRRAAAAGASAIVLTVDTTALRPDIAAADTAAADSVAGTRSSIEPTEWPDGPERARLVNLTEDERTRIGSRPGPNPTPDDIGRLASASGLPVVVKGILRAEDAVRAVEAGAAGIVVSTHGGRRMGGSVTSLSALAEVVAAVEAIDPSVEVYVDSGIRSGRHVLAALALGARAVFIGRPVMWALAAGGEDAVVDLLTGLGADVEVAARQYGFPADDIRGSALHRG